MIKKVWFGESPLWRLLLPPFWLYGLANGTIHPRCKLKLKCAWRAPVPVVVVSSLIVDGNGKISVVVWLARQPQQRSIRMRVVSRGYGGKTEPYPLLLSANTTTARAGGEPVLTYQRIGASVAVSSARFNAVKAILIQHPNVQIIVTDDGLQHYRLARNVEIVVIDDARRLDNGWWLPAGPMRERAGRLESVDAVIINDDVPHSGEVSMHLLPDQAVNLRIGMRCDIAQLEHVVAIVGIGHLLRLFAVLGMCGI